MSESGRVKPKSTKENGHEGDGVAGRKKPARQQSRVRTDADKVKDLVGTLDEEAKRTLAAELVGEVFDAEDKKIAVGEAVRTAPEAARDEIAAEAARVASPETKKALAAEAVKSAADGDEHEVVAGAVGAASPEAKKTAVTEAVKTAPELDKEDIAAAALTSLASQEAQQEVASQFLPSQDVANEIWLKVVDAFKWVLWAATLALIGAIFVALFNNDVDQALLQILLTVFTTVAGIFAGFIGGKALGGTTGRPTGR